MNKKLLIELLKMVNLNRLNSQWSNSNNYFSAKYFTFCNTSLHNSREFGDFVRTSHNKYDMNRLLIASNAIEKILDLLEKMRIVEIKIVDNVELRKNMFFNTGKDDFESYHACVVNDYYFCKLDLNQFDAQFTKFYRKIDNKNKLIEVLNKNKLVFYMKILKII